MKRFAVPLVLTLVLAGCVNDSPVPPPTVPTPAPPITPAPPPPVAPAPPVPPAPPVTPAPPVVPVPPVAPPPTTGTENITGTVFVPAGGNVVGQAIVFACYPSRNEQTPCDDSLSGVIEIQPGNSGSTYTIDNLQTGQYVVLALADADGNGVPSDANDYVGFYPSVEAPALVTPPATGIDIQLVTNSEAGLAGVGPTLAAARTLDLLQK